MGTIQLKSESSTGTLKAQELDNHTQPQGQFWSIFTKISTTLKSIKSTVNK